MYSEQKEFSDLPGKPRQGILDSATDSEDFRLKSELAAKPGPQGKHHLIRKTYKEPLNKTAFQFRPSIAYSSNSPARKCSQNYRQTTAYIINGSNLKNQAETCIAQNRKVFRLKVVHQPKNPTSENIDLINRNIDRSLHNIASSNSYLGKTHNKIFEVDFQKVERSFQNKFKNKIFGDLLPDDYYSKNNYTAEDYDVDFSIKNPRLSKGSIPEKNPQLEKFDGKDIPQEAHVLKEGNFLSYRTDPQQIIRIKLLFEVGIEKRFMVGKINRNFVRV